MNDKIEKAREENKKLFSTIEHLIRDAEDKNTDSIEFKSNLRKVSNDNLYFYGLDKYKKRALGKSKKEMLNEIVSFKQDLET